jgi:lipoyl(octanoyl) transferase
MTLQVQRLGFGAAAVAYLDAWQAQREVHAAVAAGTQSDTVLLLEHEPVYTAGKRTNTAERPTDGTAVIDVDRGGRITWHGPGQIVAYPIVRLPTPVDVVAHVRRLENVMLAVCADVGLAAARVDGRSGVWVLGATEPAGSLGGTAASLDRKVAAIGVRVARGVTMHGFALNCDCDLSWAEPIIPCGIDDAGVTSLSAELGRKVSVMQVLPLVEHHLRAEFDEPRSSL